VSHLDVAHVSFALASGRVLLDDVSFRVGDGAHAALVGANGTGKTTLLRMIAGDVAPDSGSSPRTAGSA
jgi:ATPase subunit of ABC transporter with duplicated ATPase domains